MGVKLPSMALRRLVSPFPLDGGMTLASHILFRLVTTLVVLLAAIAACRRLHQALAHAQQG